MITNKTNFSDSLEKIESSFVFIDFKEQHPDAKLCAGFFILNYESEGEKNQRQLDYLLEDGKIYTFILDSNDEIQVKEAETIEGKENKKLGELHKERVKVDLEDVEKILRLEFIKKEIHKKIKSIIAILQVYNEKQIWNLTCMIEGMEIVNLQIDSETGDVLKFDRKSMLDFVKKI